MSRDSKGFTIIEVVLFLAISGLLMATLLVGVSQAISRQEYRDAVQSFAGFLRSEYSKMINVENDRPDGNNAVCQGSVSTYRGQSNCFIVGRYIETVGSDDANYGTEYASYAVYAKEVSDASGNLSWKYYRSGDEAVDALQKVTHRVSWDVKTKLSDQAANRANLFFVILAMAVPLFVRAGIAIRRRLLTILHRAFRAAPKTRLC